MNGRAVPGRRGTAARSWSPVAVVLALGCAFARGEPAAEAVRSDLLVDIGGVADIAAPANGQTLYVLEQPSGAVIAVDPSKPDRRWTALAGGGAAGPARGRRLLALACVDTTRLAVLCHEDNRYMLRVHTVQPDVTAAAEDPEQVVPVGGQTAVPNPAAGDAPTGSPAVVLGPARDWIAVCGLPPPLAGVLRAPIARGRIGAFSAAGCPRPPVPPTAAATTADDELILFAPAAPPRPPAHSPPVHLSFHRPPDARPLLDAETGLEGIRDAAVCRGDGSLWAVGRDGGAAAGSEGLWRLDAVLVAGRQGVRGTRIVPLEAPRAVCCLSDHTIAVAHGRGRGFVSLFDTMPRPAGGPGEGER